MAERSIEQLIAISKQVWARKALWYDIIDEAFTYAAPGLNPYFSYGASSALRGEQAGQYRHDHLFDGTLAVSAEKHANRMVSELFTPGQDWAKLTEGPLLGEGEAPVRQRKAMQAVQKKVFEAIRASNFYLSVNMMALDGVIAGTGVMKVGVSRDADTLIEFDACSQAEVAFEPGPRGQIWGFYRKLWLRRDDILSLWPQARPLPEKDAEDGEPRHWDVLEVTYYDVRETLWRYEVILRDGGRGRGDLRIYHRTYHVCPWVVWRYSLLPGEVQGRSPCFKATPAARTVNHAKRVRLETASLRAVPAFTYVDDSVFNPDTVRIAPGVFIPVGSNDQQNPSIRPMEVSGDIQLNEIVIEDERAQIRAALLDNILPEPTGAVRSATEIIERQREAQQTLGSPYLRMVEEVGRPVLRAVAYMLSEVGQLEELAEFGQVDEEGTPMPLRLDGTDVAVKFSSPLVLAQPLSDAQTIVQWAESVQRSFGPEALISGANVEAAPRILGKLMGVDAALVRDEKEAEQMLQQQMAQPAQGAPMQ